MGGGQTVGKAVATGAVHVFALKRQEIHVAWTIDDGPTAHGTKLNSKMSDEVVRIRKSRGDKVGKSKNLVPATWYIQRDFSRSQRKRALLESLQAEGDEIAIHSFHKTKNHCEWFPGGGSGGNISIAYDRKQPWLGIADAMRDLTSFTHDLRKWGLHVRFVRMPGGFRSEVRNYLINRSVALSKLGPLVTELVTSISSENPGTLSYPTPPPGRVQRLAHKEELRIFYSQIQQTLKKLGLHLWEGSHRGQPELTASNSGMSWEAESHSNWSNVKRKFNQRLKAAQGNPGGLFSLVILTHEHNSYHPNVLRDIREMESAAHAAKMTIRYHTMSSLYSLVR